MRITEEQREFLRDQFNAIDDEMEIYLFGSRVHDNQRGGDIDILILSSERLSRRFLREVKVNFYERFGYQKIDLVNFTFEEEDSFKELALIDGEPV